MQSAGLKKIQLSKKVVEYGVKLSVVKYVCISWGDDFMLSLCSDSLRGVSSWQRLPEGRAAAEREATRYGGCCEGHSRRTSSLDGTD